MKRLLALAVVLALGAGSVQAKAAYCQDKTTHKRISCKVAATIANPATMTPALTAGGTLAPPAKKPGLLSGLMKPKASAPSPTQSPIPPRVISTNGSNLSRSGETGGAPHCTKGKVCGHSCIALDKVCHKPG